MTLNIIFMGTPDFAVPILKSINNLNHNVLEVYTQPPNKKNRGQKIQISPIHDFSNKLNLPVRCPIAFEEEEINHIKNLNPDLVVVAAYGKILPAELLNLDKVLFINVHASLLPKWRGAAPIQRAIMNLDHETGVSIMKIVTKLDAGPVLLQLIENDQKAFLALKIVEIIGEDEPYQLDPETIYFVTNLLNKMNLVKIRNKVLNSALPLRT